MTRPGALLMLLAGAILGAGLLAVAVWNPLNRAWMAQQTASLPVSGERTTRYTCGVHPDIVRPEPGNCPICGMRLVRHPHSAPQPAVSKREVLYWRAPMNPDYRSDRPGKSPMGMDLVPVYADDTGTAEVRVSSGFLQNFAVRTEAVTTGVLPVTIRTVGILAHNEEKVVSVNTKFEGWIEKARVNNIGETVTAGDVLFEIYSPQLVTTEREYLAAMGYVERLRQGDAYPAAIARAESLLEAARERLRYWDVSAAQIDALGSARAAPRTVEFTAPASGLVVQKAGDSLEGMKLAPGMTVLKIADHSTLWAKVDFFEEDLRHVHEGSLVSIEVDAFPGRRWDGRILFFRPALNPQTRALTALVEVSNPDLELRPMMYVNVFAQVDGASDALLVPAESVLHSGERAVVVVARDGGRFEPREVELGGAAEGLQEIRAGLRAGERVVVSSQFLIDSESNLKAATSRLLRGGASDQSAPPGADRRHQH